VFLAALFFSVLGLLRDREKQRAGIVCIVSAVMTVASSFFVLG
jgi:hypothetical protein